MVARGPALGPPMLICLLLLLILAMASITCFLHLFNDHLHAFLDQDATFDHQMAAVTWQDPSFDTDKVEVSASQQGNFQYGRVWSPVQSLRQLLPHATPRVPFQAPVFPGNGFLFATIRGELHEMHAAICDLVVIARLLNATLVLPKIQGLVAGREMAGVHTLQGAVSVGCLEVASSKEERFSYLYDEWHFINALKNDVQVMRLLPKKFHSRVRLRKEPLTTLSRFSSIRFYLDEVLPILQRYGGCRLVLSGGGGLQSLLPGELVEYQRLRCRVAFHALRLRKQIYDLGIQIVKRLEAQGRPYVVIHFGLERDVLAYHGCAELFQDLQTESIHSQRAFLLKTGKIGGYLRPNSHKQRHEGFCPFMPAEVGFLLEAFGFRKDTRIYVAGTEITGGQRVLLPLRSMYPNLDNYLTLSTLQERSELHAFEQLAHTSTVDNVFARFLKRWLWWGTKGAFGHHYNTFSKGWWRSVGDCEYNTEQYFSLTSMEGEAEDNKLIYAALDYVVSLEANTFFPAFDRDWHGFPSISSLIMGHRLLNSPSLKTFRPNRSGIMVLLDNHLNKGRSWMLSAREMLTKSLGPEALAYASLTLKPNLFLAHPLPECACRSGDLVLANESRMLGPDGRFLWGGEDVCPARMVNKV